jgi:uncharacterized protein YndB with AHSA1/START domain
MLSPNTGNLNCKTFDEGHKSMKIGSIGRLNKFAGTNLMLAIILFLVAVVVVLFVIIVAARPGKFTVARSTLIGAQPETVFDQVNNLRNWEPWSPWAKLDPSAKTKYDGPPEGLNAGFGWDGNKSGAGHMTIIESRPPQLVRFRLDFERPFKGTNQAEFTFKAQGEGTVVTWTLTGKSNFIMKAFGLFVDCDKMCGTQFENGLADLKIISENSTKLVS